MDVTNYQSELSLLLNGYINYHGTLAALKNVTDKAANSEETQMEIDACLVFRRDKTSLTLFSIYLTQRNY